MKKNSNQLPREDIKAYSQLAGNQQIIRKIKIGDLDVIVSAEDNHTIDLNAYAGLNLALFAEQITLSGSVKANKLAVSTDILVLGTGAELDTSGADGLVTPGVAVDSPGKEGDNGHDGGHLYLYVNSFSTDGMPITFNAKGGRGGTGQASENKKGGTGGTGGKGGDIVILFSNSYLVAQDYLKKIASSFSDSTETEGNPANIVAYIDAFCSIMTMLYPTSSSQKNATLTDNLTLKEAIEELQNFSKTFSTGGSLVLPSNIKSIIIDLNNMLQSLGDQFKNQYLKQNLNASGGEQGLGGQGSGGSDNGLLGKAGKNGEVIELGFTSSENLIEGLLSPDFYNLTDPFLFIHPNQLQMVLEKARLQILFSDPSKSGGIANIKDAKNLLDRLSFKTKYLSQLKDDESFAKFFGEHEQLLGCQNSLAIFNQVYNEATQMSNQLIQGLDAYGHDYNFAPRGTYQMYKSALDEMINSFIEIETAYLQYSKKLSEQTAEVSYLTDQTSQLNTIESQSQQNINAINSEIETSIDLVESLTKQLTPYTSIITGDISQIVLAIKDSFDFDVKAFLGSLTSIAFAPESALMWGTQATSILYSGITNIKNDQGIDVKKSYLVDGIKQISGVIKGQTLAESFNQLNSGIIQLQDPGGNKIIADENQLMKMLDQFYSKFPTEIDDLKKEFKNYIDLIQKRNSEILKYNQLLVMAEKELISLNKARLLISNINQKKFDDIDPALPEISSYMTYIYNHARSELLEQLYRASKAFDFWSVTKSNKLANSLNGISPQKVDSYLLQSINLSLESAFEGSPGFFPSPTGTFSGDSALRISLNDFQVGLLKAANSSTLTIPIPNSGSFFNRADVRLTQVGVDIKLKQAASVGQEIFIDLIQLGKEKIQNPSSLEWFDYVHSPVVVQCGYNTKTGKIIPASLVSNQTNNNQELQLANIGPYATWRVQINPKKNINFDISQIQSVTLIFDGTFYDTISSKYKASII
ncbi:hypothetical protein QYS48_15670 [Marivirga arenosa]|uniref:Uncharacterized protein n=1 Tax=Marivirga arenosa TaxID=3059076 RepID=A0AA49JD85_9BACT|nr:hypothetical protein [Marivirga sp. ABR2-2]WKK83715.2 hypothetical protein QYS48_15670 [Marivirga sp. ABR2-2]